jgi:phenylalanyl-tRNA synthetase beta subunit
MRVPYKWLQQYVAVDLPPQELAAKLTMAGLAVEDIDNLAPGFQGVVAGRINSITPHPNSDHLVVCRVDAGRELQLVTGAPNVYEGQAAAVALDGARLPGGQAIRRSTFRGVDSEGMLCSAQELGLDVALISPEDREGIITLPPDAAPGADVAAVLGLNDVVLVLELTPNRADCLSVINVAREVAALTGAPLNLPAITVPEDERRLADLATVAIEAPDLCARYVARLVSGVRIGPSPAWLQARLRAAGMRPINNVVDITNFIMLEMGQPLHAFDYDLLQQHAIIVRRAEPGEKLQTLDNVERELDAEMLVIADAARPVAVAGVMGGLDTEVTPETTNILIEAAHFDGASIRRTSRRLGLRSEASTRFERGVNLEGAAAAADRAAQLMAELAGGSVARGRIDCYVKQRRPVVIFLRPQRVNYLLGTDLAPAAMKELLARLHLRAEETGAVAARDGSGAACRSAYPGNADPAAAVAGAGSRPEGIPIADTGNYMEGIPVGATSSSRGGIQLGDVDGPLESIPVADAGSRPEGTPAGDGDSHGDGRQSGTGTPVSHQSPTSNFPHLTSILRVAVPAYRSDLTQEIDLVEEIARLYGYNNIPVTLPGNITAREKETPAQRCEEAGRQAAAAAGLAEVITYSFTGPRALDQLQLPPDHPWRRTVKVQNPLREEQSIMRPSLLPGLLEAAARNASRRVMPVAIFEMGRVFIPSPRQLPDEPLHLGGLVMGVTSRGWNWPAVEMDFYYLKGVVENILARAGGREITWEAAAAYPFLHPGRAATIHCGDATLGFLGEVHPDVLAALDLPARACVFELDWERAGNLDRRQVGYEPLPRFPAVERDLAVVVPAGVPAAAVASAIQEAAGAMLRVCTLFDVYQGAPVPAGYRSLAYSLVYQLPDRTLTDAEVNAAQERVQAALQDRMGATLRV